MYRFGIIAELDAVAVMEKILLSEMKQWR